MVTFSSEDESRTSAAVWAGDPQRHSLVDLALHDCSRVVVVGAHPDDEALGAGGLVATVRDMGLRVQLVLLTAGEGSHPHSPTMSRDQLAALRLQEAAQAWVCLTGSSDLECWHLPDGEVSSHEESALSDLTRLVGDGRSTILVAPWRHDGHPDHESAGRIAAAAARRTGARLLEYPIWHWHWATSEETPWADMVRLRLSPDVEAAKRRGIAAHRSQVSPLSTREGDEVMLGPSMLAHFCDGEELFIERAVRTGDDPALEQLHAEQPEPWGADQRWYEQRKRLITMALLPRPRHVRALEVGCSTGALALDLSSRCEEVLAVDASPTATAAAAKRLANRRHADAQCMDVPRQWPTGMFDLVVISEMAYFLSPLDLDRLVQRVDDSLAAQGTVVLCHWRHEVEGWPLTGQHVHARFRAHPGLVRLASYVEEDFDMLLLGRSSQLLPRPTE